MISTRTDVLAARNGDPEAFARLVHGNASAVCAITTAILGSPSAGEEVGQEVFVCAWQGLSRLEDPDRFGAWLRGIARNRAKEALRVRSRRREVASPALAGLADPAPEPGERLDDQQKEATLWEALEGLDPDHREVLVLYYREGRSVEQVALHLELPEATVRKRLSRARERLRDGVGERLGARIERSAPKTGALVAAVASLIAALAPLPARAAVGAARPMSLSRVAWAPIAAVGAAALVSVAIYADLRRELPEIAPPLEISAGAPSPVLGDTVDPEIDRPRPSAPDDRVPERVVHAFLAAEDARFFEHGAVDPWSIGRAAYHNWTGGGALQGGSTLTQQLAKRMLVDRMPEPSLRRKASEVLLALELERSLTKEQILASYLDGVYLGAGARGLEEAARLYFDKAPGELTLSEAALLAGIPSHPEANGPFASPEGALSRRAEVLARMEENGWASPSEVSRALAEPLPVRRP